jgi:hypothetical protein
MKNSIRILIGAGVLSVSIAVSPPHGYSQLFGNRAERQALANRECERALQLNTPEALREFRRKFWSYRTACSALAFNRGGPSGAPNSDFGNGGPPFFNGGGSANQGGSEQGGSEQGGSEQGGSEQGGSEQGGSEQGGGGNGGSGNGGSGSGNGGSGSGNGGSGS